jgi:riboflavin synthase
MFTGIVTHTGVVDRIVDGSGRTLEIVPMTPMSGLTVGASVAHSGICLTLVELTAHGWRVQASAETLSRTTLGDWRQGDRINLERSLRLGDELGGHLVFGHVDGVAEILEIDEEPGGHRMVFTLPPELAPLVAVKGSIAVDGVSVTVTEIKADRFATVIVPHTRSFTTLGERVPGDRVNLEVDMLARYVARQLALHRQGAVRD